eukprot:4290607-Amphidinium_carterae.3
MCPGRRITEDLEKTVYVLNNITTVDMVAAAAFDDHMEEMHTAAVSEFIGLATHPWHPHHPDATVQVNKELPQALRSHRVHVMEIFGGAGGGTRLAWKRHLRTGPNIDLEECVDITDRRMRHLVLQYIKKFRTAILVLGPPCTSFGGWAHLNKHKYPDTWARSQQLGILCSRFAAD